MGGSGSDTSTRGYLVSCLPSHCTVYISGVFYRNIIHKLENVVSSLLRWHLSEPCPWWLPTEQYPGPRQRGAPSLTPEARGQLLPPSLAQRPPLGRHPHVEGDIEQPCTAQPTLSTARCPGPGGQACESTLVQGLQGGTYVCRAASLTLRSEAENTGLWVLGSGLSGCMSTLDSCADRTPPACLGLGREAGRMN